MVFIKLKEGTNYVRLLTNKLEKCEETRNKTQSELEKEGYFTSKYPPNEAETLPRKTAYLLYFPEKDMYEIEFKER